MILNAADSSFSGQSPSYPAYFIIIPSPVSALLSVNAAFNLPFYLFFSVN
ncbi:MAG: hypothetical protein LBH92_05415 [Bacteroidales bacterium]|jgi:hypothetical protein|nr:hypothetical protein [Bacteroidales bacterium]